MLFELSWSKNKKFPVNSLINREFLLRHAEYLRFEKMMRKTPEFGFSARVENQRCGKVRGKPAFTGKIL